MIIREFRLGDEPELYQVFFSAIHEIASQDYTPQQVNAWAPIEIDRELWGNKMLSIQPFVVETCGQIVAYADVQASGYIDNFFVSGAVARQGVGSMLMNHIHQIATAQGMKMLTSHVSLTAQPFFAKFGFSIIEQRSPVIRGVVFSNALMSKNLDSIVA
jgi:putative acetyltransferase